MRRFLLSLAVGVLLVPVAAAKNHNMSISFDDDFADITSCDQMKIRFGDDHSRGFRAEEQVPVRGARSLKVRSAKNGGIYVSGGSGQMSVTACKASEFEDSLRDIRITTSGNEVTADVGDRNTVVYFLVSVPRGAELDLEANNGPISLRNVNGKVVAHATNGPISIKQSSGSFDLDTQNGPISLSGGSGTVKLNAQNGPISVRFDNNTWDGSLDARTQNGPLSLRLPRDFRSGLVVESNGHGPVSCRGEACREARRTWDDDDDRHRRIEIGSGPTVVRMSTVNGPISVKDVE